MQNNNILCKILNGTLKILPLLFWTTLIFGFDTPKIAFATLICALIHEAGHMLCALLLARKFSLKSVTSGFRISLLETGSYSEEIFIAAAGPLMNILTFALSNLISPSTQMSTFEFLCIMTAVSNLLPLKGYDGYRILSCLLSLLPREDVTHRILERLSFSIIVALCFVSLYFMARFNGGYWIFFIFILSLAKKFMNDEKVIISKETREKKRF